MWVGAGAAGSKRGGWAGRSCRRPRGRVEAGSDRAGRGRAREEGRMAWGQKCHWEEKAGGRGTGPGGGSGEGSAGHCVASGDLGREGRNTRPRAVDAKGCLCPHGRALWSGQQLNRAGTKPWRLSALLPGGGHRRRAGSTAPLLSWGRSVRAAPQPTSPQAAELAVSLATPTRICEGGEGTFCQGSGPPSPTWPRPAP